MNRALLFLMLRSLRGRVIRALRLLKEPKYLIGVGAFVLWMTFTVGLPFLFDNDDREISVEFFNAGLVFEIMGDALPMVQLLVALVFALGLSLWWLVPWSRAVLDLSEAEIHVLTPMPVKRRDLIQYAVLKSQPGIMFGCTMLTIFLGSGGPAARTAWFLSFWLLLTLWDLHAKGRSLWLQRQKELPTGRAWRNRLLLVSAIMAYWVVLGANLAILFSRITNIERPQAPETARDMVPFVRQLLLEYSAQVEGSTIELMLTPFRWITAPLFISAPGVTTALQLTGLLVPVVLLLAQNEWVVRSQSKFEEASLAHAKREAKKTSPGARYWKHSERSRQRTSFDLSRPGSPELAILWKNSMMVTRFSYRTLALFGAGGVGFALLIPILLASRLTALPYVILIGGFFTMLIAPPIGVQSYRNDMRADLLRLEVIRPWPIVGWKLFAAEVASPVVFAVGYGLFGAAVFLAIDFYFNVINPAAFLNNGEQSYRFLAPEIVASLGVPQFLLMPLIVLGALPLVVALTCLSASLQNLLVMVFPRLGAARQRETAGRCSLRAKHGDVPGARPRQRHFPATGGDHRRHHSRRTGLGFRRPSTGLGVSDPRDHRGHTRVHRRRPGSSCRRPRVGRPRRFARNSLRLRLGARGRQPAPGNPPQEIRGRRSYTRCMRKLVLFDIDGTLLSTEGAAGRAFAAAMIDVYGTAGPIGEVSFAGKTDPQIAHELLAGAGRRRDEVEPRLEELWSRYIGYLDGELEESVVRVFGGVAECLEMCEQRRDDTFLGLLTGNIREGARRKVNAAQLRFDRFRVGGFGCDSEHRNELPAITAERAAQLTGKRFRGADVVIVGDTPADIACGDAFGARNDRRGYRQLLARRPRRVRPGFSLRHTGRHRTGIRRDRRLNQCPERENAVINTTATRARRLFALAPAASAAHNQNIDTHRDSRMKLLRVSAVALTLLGFPALASAQDTIKLSRGNISGFGSFAAAQADGLDSGHGFGFSGAYFFGDTIGVEGAYRRQGFTIEETDTNLLAPGDLNANVITLNVVARLSSGRVQPYGTGGVAFFMNDYSTDSSTAQQLAQFNFTPNDSVENTVGFNVGGGVDIQASRSIGIFVEGRYFIATADTDRSLIDDFTQVTANDPGEQKLNYLTLNVGVRIYF